MPKADEQPIRGRPRVVYVTHRVPYPPDKGDRIRNYHLLRQLARVADVSLASLADEPVSDEQLGVLRGLAKRVAIVPVSRVGRWVRTGLGLVAGGSLSEWAFYEPAMARLMDEWRLTTDAVVVSASSLVQYLGRTGFREPPGFVDLVDVDSQKWADFAAATRGPKRLLYRLESRRLRGLEASLPKRVAGVALLDRYAADLGELGAG